MAMQTETPPAAPSAQVVGNAFVEQYYHILHHSPELVFRFYLDTSVLSRPGPDGVMTTVTTMKVSLLSTEYAYVPSAAISTHHASLPAAFFSFFPFIYSAAN
ncbi:ras GTPase-activating -binding 2 [Olea europaea subsp. europaea]|uniref:Ras GTPase-activating -binding 2 n=1 Tax=Olea europaea subsp. europaea TaxID=158383 RepID=A0A8S0RGZ4_OLEEU|nr:ras GTPase-activating -binding 2 [Olea europaea subsp. europaea]